jgi:chromosome segregation ATPase
MTVSTRSTTSRKRDFTASALLAGVLVAVAVSGVATLSASGSGALQHAMELAGLGRSTALEQEQQRQAATIAGLDAVVMTLNSELGDLARQQQVKASHEDGLLERIAELDRELASLRDRIAREGLFQQDTVLRGALTDLTALQTTVQQNHETQQKAIAGLQTSLEQNQAAQQKVLAAVTHRLEQIETTLAQREVTSSTGTKPARRASLVRSKPRLSPPVLTSVPDTIRID